MFVCFFFHFSVFFSLYLFLKGFFCVCFFLVCVFFIFHVFFVFFFIFLLFFVACVSSHPGRSKVTRATVGRDTDKSFRVCKVNLATLKSRNKLHPKSLSGTFRGPEKS